MSQNEPKTELTETQLKVAALVAAELTNDEFAGATGISVATLRRWKQLDAFDAAVQRATERMDRAALRFAVARRDKRLQTINDLYNKGLAVIDAHACTVILSREGEPWRIRTPSSRRTRARRPTNAVWARCRTPDGDRPASSRSGRRGAACRSSRRDPSWS